MLKKETGVLSGIMPPQTVNAGAAPPPAAIGPKVLAEKGIGPDPNIEEQDQEEKDD